MNKRALIAMSGGVDSSVAALLMKQKGYECIGITMKLFDSEDMKDAENICRRLEIPYYVVDYKEEFKENVIDKFVSTYLKGHTPNPCIDCNKTMKFGRLYEKAAELGCDTIVTGHYVLKEYDEEKGEYVLKKARDLSKDQSYFLYFFSQEQLSHIEFPLGEYTKEEIRKIAEENGFINAKKHDSQDICFVPDGDYKKVIKKCAVCTEKIPESGNFVDRQGNILGTHKGIYSYTIGQRKGLGIAAKEPLYVCEIRTDTNEVVLGKSEDLFTKSVHAENVSFINAINKYEKEVYNEGIRVSAKIRYRHKEQPGILKVNSDGSVDMVFDEPQRAATSGQSLVIYDGDRVMGGGIIWKKY